MIWIILNENKSKFEISVFSSTKFKNQFKIIAWFLISFKLNWPILFIFASKIPVSRNKNYDYSDIFFSR